MHLYLVKLKNGTSGYVLADDTNEAESILSEYTKRCYEEVYKTEFSYELQSIEMIASQKIYGLDEDRIYLKGEKLETKKEYLNALKKREQDKI